MNLSIKEIQNELLEVAKFFHSFCIENGINYYLLGGSALGAIRHNGFIPWDDDIDVGLTRENYEKFLSLFPRRAGKYILKNYRIDQNADYFLTRIYIDDIGIEYSPEFTKISDKRLYFDIFPLDDCPPFLKDVKKQRRKILKLKKIVLIKSYTPQNPLKRIACKLLSALVYHHNCSHYAKMADTVFQKYSSEKHSKICSMSSQYDYYKQMFDFEVYGTPTLHKFEDTFFFVPEKCDQYLSQLFGNDYMQIPPKEKQRKPHRMFRILKQNEKN